MRIGSPCASLVAGVSFAGSSDFGAVVPSGAACGFLADFLVLFGFGFLLAFFFLALLGFADLLGSAA